MRDDRERLLDVLEALAGVTRPAAPSSATMTWLHRVCTTFFVAVLSPATSRRK